MTEPRDKYATACIRIAEEVAAALTAALGEEWAEWGEGGLADGVRLLAQRGALPNNPQPGSTYVTLRIDDPEQADDLLRDMAEYPDHDLLSPCLEHVAHAVLASAVRDGQPYTPPEPAEVTA